MKIIGLTGLARSGKDTAAGFAMEWCATNGVRAERLALADPLKVSAARALGAPDDWTTEQCVEFCNELKHDCEVDSVRYIPGSTGPEPEPPEWQILTKISGREFLQRYGTEAHRDVFGQDFWTEVAAKRVRELEREGIEAVFITDVRFPNEADFVHGDDDYHGEVWKIQREGAGLSDGLEAHSSEAGLGENVVDALILNEGTLDDLREAVDLMCASTNMEGY